jgi:hypothetical protein
LVINLPYIRQNPQSNGYSLVYRKVLLAVLKKRDEVSG